MGCRDSNCSHHPFAVKFLAINSCSSSYHAGLTEPLSRIVKKEGISTSIRTRGSLREKLVKPKDKIPPAETTGVIYFEPCAGANGVPCDGRYVGETGRALSSRVEEHFSTATRFGGQYKSAILQHARDNGHHFRKADFSIIDRDDDWFSRGVRESAYIRALKPTINDHPGRHQLPHIYDPLLSKAIKEPPAPPAHDEALEPLLNTAPRLPGRPRRHNEASQTTQQRPQQQRQQQPPSHPMTTRRRALGGPPTEGTPD